MGQETDTPSLGVKVSPFMQKFAGLLIGGPMGLLFLALGLWIIHMALHGRAPAEPIPRREVPAALAMGVFCAWGGLQTIILMIGGERLPKWVHAVLLSVFMLLLAVPFLLAGILTPDLISSTASIGPFVFGQSTGGRSGGIAFIAAGVLVLVALPFVVRQMLSKTNENRVESQRE